MVNNILLEIFHQFNPDEAYTYSLSNRNINEPCINVLNEPYKYYGNYDLSGNPLGIGKIVYEKGTGKFEKYDGAQCVYAITFLPERDVSFIKSKCTFKDK